MTSIDSIITEHSDKTVAEFKAWVKDNPTGDTFRIIAKG